MQVHAQCLNSYLNTSILHSVACFADRYAFMDMMYVLKSAMIESLSAKSANEQHNGSDKRVKEVKKKNELHSLFICSPFVET